MGRIRSIKPEFPQSERIGRLSREARLLFIQIWTLVDDSGRARAASRGLASLLYPFDEDAPSLIEGWLGELEREECIRRYKVDGSTYLEVIKWLEHQKIDRPSKSKFPPFDEASRVFVEGSRGLDDGSGSGSGMGKGSGPRREARAKGARLPPNWMPTVEGVRYAQDKGLSEKDTNTELEKFANYWTAKSGQQATKVDWDATWRNWIITAAERKSTNGHAGRPKSLGDRARELADEVRREERARGIVGPNEPFRGH